MRRKLLSVFIALAMILTLMPTLVFAGSEAACSATLTIPEGKSLLYNGDTGTLNFYDVVDSITIKQTGVEDITYSKEDFEYVHKKDGQVDDYLCYYYSRIDYSPGETTAQITINFYNEKDSFAFSQTFTVAASATYKAISFNQTSVTIDSKAARKTDEDGTYYDIYVRNPGRFFRTGDKITVEYTESAGGGSKVFAFDETANNFVCDGEHIYVYLQDYWDDKYPVGEYSYNIGLNKDAISLSLGSAVTFIDLIIDNSQEAAEAAEQARQAAIAAAEAARQGTPGNLPKAKASKPKASKKAITVKWKKLNKKQLKTGVSKIEVWVSPDGSFASGSTIEKTAGKKKSSLKIKGLAKGTYYVKVRAITYSGATKVVGPWSATKKVKVKK